jgi:hypothetical protein
MTDNELSRLVSQIEAHIECWKQFNHYLSVARSKKIGPAQENQFLELKSILVQELESIFAAIESTTPSRDEIIQLISNTPSLHHLSETHENALRNTETQWHRIYIGWHSVLGQLKVKQAAAKTKKFWRKKI